MGKIRAFQTEGPANENGLRYLVCFKVVKEPIRLEEKELNKENNRVFSGFFPLQLTKRLPKHMEVRGGGTKGLY